jgi:hypothetical protein
VKDKKIIHVGEHVTIPKNAEVVNLSNSWGDARCNGAHAHITEGGMEHFQDLNMVYLRESSGFEVCEACTRDRSC